MLLHIVVHTKRCLFEDETLFRSALFSFCGVHVCAPFVRMFWLVGRMSLVSQSIYFLENVLTDSSQEGISSMELVS
jgi:hypothetical protein